MAIMTLGELFAREEAKAIARHLAEEADPEYQARQKTMREERIASEIRQGLRDENGEWIEGETVEDEDDDFCLECGEYHHECCCEF